MVHCDNYKFVSLCLRESQKSLYTALMRGLGLYGGSVLRMKDKRTQINLNKNDEKEGKKFVLTKRASF